MLKKIVATSLILASGVAVANYNPCPVEFSCSIVDAGQVQCSELTQGWSATANGSGAGNIDSTNATFQGATWEKINDDQSVLTCSYEQGSSYQSSVWLQIQTTANLKPDTSDSYGWQWMDGQKSTAQCNHAACKLDG